MRMGFVEITEFTDADWKRLLRYDKAEEPRPCSDYDESCEGMTFHHAAHCYFGCERWIDGKKYSLGLADGFCPILNHSN